MTDTSELARRVNELRESDDTDTLELARTLNDLASACFNSDPVNSTRYAEEALAFLEESNDNYQKGRSLRILGAGCWTRGDFPNGLEQLEESLRFFRETGSMKDIAGTLNNIGLIYDRTGDYDKALETHLHALSIREELNDRDGLGFSLSNIGNIYSHLEDYHEALDYYERALAIREELGDSVGIADATSNIGMVNASLENYDVALDCYSTAYSIYKEVEHRTGIANSCINIGNSLLRQDEYARALRYFMIANDEYTATDNRWGVALSSLNMGVLYMKQDNVELAEEFFFRSLDISREIGERNFTMKLYKHLSDLYEKREEYRKALEYHREYSIMREDLIGGRRAKEIMRLEAQQLFRQKESVLLEKQKEYRQLSITDPLTGLYNRRFFLDETARIIMKTGESEEALSLAMIDVDRLKLVNDTLGHTPGDHVLEQLAALLRKTLRPDDIAARFGGDEFIVLLRHCDASHATNIFRKFATRAKKNLTELTGGEIEVTISCGIAGNDELPPESRNTESLIELADQRLYSSKNAGRNRVTGS